MIVKTCEICGKEFHVPPYRKDSAKYCSEECYHKSTIVDKNHTCQNCGVIFKHKRKDIKFCSFECACKFRRNQPKTAKICRDGYKRIWLSDGSSIMEHIFVMEQHIGRKLKNNECVHHIDENRANNDISNLRLMTIGEHSRLHRKKELAEGKKLFGKDQNNEQ